MRKLELPDAADTLFPADERQREAGAKQERIAAFLQQHKLDAVLLMRHENIAWATAGLVEMRVAIPSETAVGWLLFTRNGGRYYLAPGNEAPRLAAEEFQHLDYQPILRNWYATDWLRAAQSAAGFSAIACDHPSAGLPVVSLQPLRLALVAGERDRLRWLGKHTAEATTEVLLALEPGMTEPVMQAMVAQALLRRGILPSVFLMATDDRILRYRHAVPRAGVLHHFGMLNLCARRWGLAVSITRFVHFGPMPVDLRARFQAAASVYARLQAATHPGATSSQLFQVAQSAYAEAGFPGEEQMHHQGGAAGYAEREWLARPGGTEVVQDMQAFAWNPSIQGGKVEDTTLLEDGQMQTVTITPQLPVVPIECGGRTYATPGVLER